MSELKDLWRQSLDRAFSCHIEKLFGVLIREDATAQAVERFWAGAHLAIEALAAIEESAAKDAATRNGRNT